MLPLAERYSTIPTEGRPRSRLLASTLADLRSSATQCERWRAIAASAVEQRVAAIVSAKHRGAYGRAARLAVACGEAIALADEARAGAAFVAEIRGRFPRHVAFRGELDRAERQSPLLASPPVTRRR